MIRINEVKFELDETFDDFSIRSKICKKTRLKPEQLISYRIIRESVDARKGIVFSYTIDIEATKESLLQKNGFKQAPERFVPIDIEKKALLVNKGIQSSDRPVVIGFGPCGIFAALQLARAGLKPIILEMGEDVDARLDSVERFWNEGTLKTHSNVQFGEGGAGAFSDGKLTTRIKDTRIEFVLNEMVKAGAPEEIIYKNKPHIGTDLLCGVVKNIRNEIIHLGGEVYFNSKVVDFSFMGDEEVAVITDDGNKYVTKYVVLATGHSAREMYETLKLRDIQMERKPFAMGVRIEHPQSLINAAQYGANHQNKKLGAADYKLTYSASNGRSVYSFCMCPGGRVVASASESGRLVVNGMSYHSRSLQNANSALLVNINPDDFESEDVLAGVALQRKLEEKAYSAGGGAYVAPASKLEDFLNLGTDENRLKTEERLRRYRAFYAEYNIDYEKEMASYKVSYTPDVKYAPLDNVLLPFMYNAIAEAIHHFGKQIPGFDDPRVVITAVESRSSSPVRILRNPETYRSLSHPGIYPCGEGAGYAGGITSSAVDGVKVAEEIIKSYLKI